MKLAFETDVNKSPHPLLFCKTGIQTPITPLRITFTISAKTMANTAIGKQDNKDATFEFFP